MKRLWIGIVVLGALLVLGGVISLTMDTVHIPIARKLQTAGTAAMEEDWETALQQAAAAQDAWTAHWCLTAAFADHTPMDEMDGLFAELKIYGQLQEKTHFAATCAHLAQLAEAMGESHSPSWWNLL